MERSGHRQIFCPGVHHVSQASVQCVQCWDVYGAGSGFVQAGRWAAQPKSGLAGFGPDLCRAVGDQPCIWPNQFVDVRRLQLPVGHGGMLRLFAALAVLFAAAVCQYSAHGGRHGVGRAAGWLVKREYQRRNAGLFGAGRRCCVQAGAQAARLDDDRPGGGAGWVCFAHHRARQL